jgi:hypothetical protein
VLRVLRVLGVLRVLRLPPHLRAGLAVRRCLLQRAQIPKRLASQRLPVAKRRLRPRYSSLCRKLPATRKLNQQQKTLRTRPTQSTPKKLKWAKAGQANVAATGAAVVAVVTGPRTQKARKTSRARTLRQTWRPWRLPLVSCLPWCFLANMTVSQRGQMHQMLGKMRQATGLIKRQPLSWICSALQQMRHLLLILRVLQ